jgi:hypothetical protein
MNSDDLRYELTLLRDLGFTHLDVRQPTTDNARSADDGQRGEAAELLSELEAIAVVCEKCKLSKSRTQVVYGVGNPNAALMFIGEAPGRDEDLKGEPFVGRAGQLLTDIIKAMKLTRDGNVYIANVINAVAEEPESPGRAGVLSSLHRE